MGFHEFDDERLYFDGDKLAWDSTCILTISAWNNFGFVKSFFKTAAETNPKLKCHVWFVADNPDPWTPDIKDAVENGIKPEIPEDWIVITLHDVQPLVDYNLAELAMRYDLVCFNTAVKPLAFQWIFMKTEAKSIMYFDNDIWIMQPLTTIVGLLERYSFVMTPHLLRPYDIDGKQLDERNIAQAGVMNFGYVGLSKSQSTLTFLDWWAQRLRFYGYVDVAKGMHFDQNWADFIPIFWDVSEYFVLREPEFNIAYWNMHYTGDGITFEDSVVRLHGRPVVFMHFSGASDYQKYNIQQISRHQNRLRMSGMKGQIRDVFEAYTQILNSNNCLRWRNVPYGFNTFENGVSILNIMRQYYGKVAYFANNNPDSTLFRKTVHGNPFCIAMKSSTCGYYARNESFWEWLLDGAHHFPLDADANLWLPEFIYQIYLLRSDVMAAFPRPFGKDHDEVFSWFFQYGIVEFQLHVSENRYTQALRERGEVALSHTKNGKKKRKWGINLFGYFLTPFDRGGIELMIHRSFALSKANLGIVQVPDRWINSLQSHTATSYSFKQGMPFTRKANDILNVFIIGPENIDSFFDIYPERKFWTHYNLAIILWDWSSMPFSFAQILSQFTEIWTLSDFTADAIRKSRGWSGEFLISMKFSSSRSAAGSIAVPDLSSTKQAVALEELFISYEIPTDAFLYLTIIDKYCEDRDNLIGSVTAFVKAFPTKERVNGDQSKGEAHYVVVFNPKQKYGISKLQLHELEYILNKAQAPSIHFVTVEISEAALEVLRSRADCYLSLHASTGFSHEIFEVFINGGIALTTDYGGHLDCIRTAPFDTSDLLVGYRSITKQIKCDFMDHEAVVAVPDIEEAAAKIKYVWENEHAVRKQVTAKVVPLMKKCYGNVESDQIFDAFKVLAWKVKMYDRVLNHK